MRDYNKGTQVCSSSEESLCRGTVRLIFSNRVPYYVSFCSLQALMVLVADAYGLPETQPPIATEPMYCLSLAHCLSKCFVSKRNCFCEEKGINSLQAIHQTLFVLLRVVGCSSGEMHNFYFYC